MQSLKGFTIYTKPSLTVEESYALYANAAALGASQELLEEDAGFAVASALMRKHRQDRMLFVCGTGGKGSIGLSAARHALMHAEVEVVLIGQPSEIEKKSTRLNYDLLDDLLDVHIITRDDIQEFRRIVKQTDVIIDSIMGIGMRGRLSWLAINAIKAINSSGKYIVSIDVPSGINANTGARNVTAVEPDLVLVIHKIKAGVEKSVSSRSVTVLDGWIPATAELFTGPGDVMLATEPRSLLTNKYRNGSVLIIGGSPVFKGAPVLSAYSAVNALAALRTGSGYVTLMTPKSATPSLQSTPAELIIRPMSSNALQSQDIDTIKDIKHDVLLFGSGIDINMTDYRTLKALLDYEKGAGRPVVVDGTGLRLLAKYKNLITSNMVLTPHDGEFKALSGIDTQDVPLEKRLSAAIDFAKNYSCTLVLKGHDTVITDGRLLKINRAKTPALATMGSGDVLAGMIASYSALHPNLMDSAAAAVYVHSTIGDILYAKKGLHIIADDIITELPGVLRQFDVIKH